MDIRTLVIEDGDTERRPSPGCCIYCGAVGIKLTDEHVVPYALGAHSAILQSSCCVSCQNIIQPYEQRILRGQIGVFRARIGAPTRNPKDRPSHQKMQFVEINEQGKIIRDLGTREIPIDEAPFTLSVWDLAPPRILGENADEADHIGRPWGSIKDSQSQKGIALNLARSVAAETGARHVAARISINRREDFLRFLAKTAHAYAIFQLGIGQFRPLATDLILNRSDDLAQFVGGCPDEGALDNSPANMTELSIGRVLNGPAVGYTAVRIRLYPMMNTPAHMVIVGAPM